MDLVITAADHTILVVIPLPSALSPVLPPPLVPRPLFDPVTDEQMTAWANVSSATIGTGAWTATMRVPCGLATKLDGSARSANYNSLMGFTVTNPASVQAAALSGIFEDVNAACDAVNALATTCDLVMKEVTVEPLHTRYKTTLVDLVIPTGIDLGAA